MLWAADLLAVGEDLGLHIKVRVPQQFITRDYPFIFVKARCTIASANANAQFTRLEAYLHSCPQHLPKETRERELVLVVDGSIHAELIAALADRGGATWLETFVGEVQAKYVLRNRSIYLYADERLGGPTGEGPVTCVTDSRVTIVVPDMGLDSVCYLVRALRDTLIRRAEDDDFVMFHAASVGLGSGAILLVGSKGAGKTSLACHLLSANQARFIANDRLLVSPALDVHFVPLPIRIGLRTIHACAWLSEGIQRGPRLQRNAGASGPSTQDGKVELTPAEVQRMSCAQLRSIEPIKMILFPRFCYAWRGEPKVLHAKSAEALALLERSCFTPQDESWLLPWLTPRRAQEELLQQSAKRRIKQLAKLPAWHIDFGPDANSHALVASVRRVLKNQELVL